MNTIVLLGWLLISSLLGMYYCINGFFSMDNIDILDQSTSSPVDDSIHPFESQEGGKYSEKVNITASLIQNYTIDKPFDRVVLVLIDALRADMVLGSSIFSSKEYAKVEPHSKDLSQYMPYIHASIQQNQAIGYVGHANAPTVTLPRLKALTTGRVPAFIDILKNFNSAELKDDNIIEHLTTGGYRIIFYGDDTWLKLFPSSFRRSEGTSGFFTRDTVEVDNNVTRHLKEELDPTMNNSKSQDWDVLILHYLGLDHVGHLRGPYSRRMKEKLNEMDELLKNIHQSILQQDQVRLNTNIASSTLLILCSDHGMTDIGNHGGSSPEESASLMLFFTNNKSRHFEPETLDLAIEKSLVSTKKQVDLVPTLSILFDLSIPTGNTGVVLTSVLRSFLSLKDYLYGIYKNIQQMWKLLNSRGGNMSFIQSNRLKYKLLISKWFQWMKEDEPKTKIFSSPEVHELENEMTAFLGLCQQQLLENHSHYNFISIFFGWTLLLLAIGLSYSCIKKENASSLMDLSWKTCLYLAYGLILYLTSLTSSSCIENEHATWFYISTTYFIVKVFRWLHDISILSVQRNSMCLVEIFRKSGKKICLVMCILICNRILRSRNQIINYGRLNQLDSSKLMGNGDNNSIPLLNDNTISILSVEPLVSMSSSLNLFVLFSFMTLLMIYQVYLYMIEKEKRFQWIEFCYYCVFIITGFYTCAWHQVYDSDDLELMENIDGEESVWITQNQRAWYLYSMCLVFSIFWKYPPTQRLSSPQNYSTKFSRHEITFRLKLIFVLLASILQRKSNLPTVFVLWIQLELYAELIHIEFQNSQVNSWEIIWMHYFLAHGSFHALGNTHVVATIDITKSYTGCSQFYQGFVGMLTFFGTFTGPYLCMIYLLDACKKLCVNYVSLLTRIVIVQVFIFLFYSCIVYFMRFHLFIWSVFAPKLLYEMAWCLFILHIVCISSLVLE